MITIQILAFAVSAAVCATLVPLVRGFARRRGMFDQAVSSRKVHKSPIARLGGVAIVIGFLAPFVLLLLAPPGVSGILYSAPSGAGPFIVGGLAIAALGLFDDLVGSGAKQKFAVQFAVAIYVWCAGFRVEQLQLPTGAIVPLGALGIVITVGWIVGVMNAINLIDGLDGLAAGVGLIAAGTNLFLAASGNYVLMGLCMAALAGSLVAFLFYNFNPATIFMGDTGSLFLGYVLAVSSLHTHQKSSTAVSLLIPVLALALPIADTLLAMARRAIRGRPMFAGDKEHIHHRLLAIGLSHRHVVLVLYAVSVLCGLAAVEFSSLAPNAGFLLLALVACCAIAGLWRVGALRLVSVELREVRKRNLVLRRQVSGIKSGLKHASTVDDLVSSVSRLGPALSASSVRLEIRPGSLVSKGFSVTPWTGELFEERATGASVRARFPIEPSMGYLEVEWHDRESIDRDHEIAAESVCAALPLALERTTTGAVFLMKETLSSQSRNSHSLLDDAAVFGNDSMTNLATG